MHIDLKLSGDGEEIGLMKQTDSGFVLIYQFIFGTQTTDVSFGRFPDGSNNLQYLAKPTPGYANIFTGITDDDTILPKYVRLNQNYPNPFNPSTQINYFLPKPTYVQLKIFNVKGQEIRTLVNDFQTAGMKSIVWDGLDKEGQKMTSGIYLYRLDTGEFSLSKKMILVQ